MDFFCRLCYKVVKSDNHGFNQLLKHIETQNHIALSKDIPGGSQLTFQTVVNCDDGQSTASCSQEKSYLLVQSKCCYEIWTYLEHESDQQQLQLWVLCRLEETFCAMFPDSTIATKFSCEPSKGSYLISEATGPYFHELARHRCQKNFCLSFYNCLWWVEKCSDKETKENKENNARLFL